MGNGKGQDGKRGTWMVRGLERPNDWVLEVNAFCCRIISLYSHVGMVREKIWRSAFFGSAWDGTREARLNFFFGGFMMTLSGFSRFY